MSLSAKVRRAPLRAVTGAFILNSGVGKLTADDDTAKTLHGMASGTYPVVGKAQPKVFVKAVAVGEIAVGSALLLPIVPPVVAGAALAGFSAALLNMYWRTPGMHQEGNPRPTQQGVPLAKDMWMFGIGAGLIADAVLSPAHDKHLELGATVSEKRAEKSRRARRKARKAARKSATKQLSEVRAQADEFQAETAKRAQKAARKARKRAEKAAREGAGRLAEVRAEAASTAASKAKDVQQSARDLAGDHAGSTLAPVTLKAKHAGKSARHLADEYGTVATAKAKQAGHAAQEAGAKARERIAG